MQPAPGEAWLGVFMLVLNPSGKPAPAVSSFKLTDTQGNVYTPVTLPAGNPYAYRAATLAPGQQIPTIDSTAYYGPTQASLLLFKIPTSAFDNRPLTLTLTDPTDPAETATVTLDL